MDPYLEASGRWKDFHSRFINAWSEQLAERLPEGDEACIEERVQLVQVEPERRKRIEPDVAVTWKPTTPARPAVASGAVTLEPVTIPHGLVEEEMRESYIEIVHRPDRALVAVLELLSPSNKEEPGRTFYLQKRNALLLQNAHLFELDLLVGGQRLPLGGALPPGEYYVMVSRADRRFDCDVYAWEAAQPLPVLPVPLRAPDPDVLVDLAEVFRVAYERGRYARSLDYGAPPPIGLSDEAHQKHFEQVRARRTP